MEISIDQLLPIMRRASDAIMEIYADESQFRTEFKSDESPLTAADHKSNAIIIEGLAKIFPDIPVVSEESKNEAYNVRSGYENYFLIDPLDGTKEFIKRNGEFTINIAYMENSRPVAGFIYIPVEEKAYYAIHGKGAYSIGPDGEVDALRSSPFYLMEEGLKVFASRSHSDEKTSAFMAQLNSPSIMNAGSSLKFLRIAEGNAHLYPRRAPTMEWDTAAAQCILQEAGGSILSLVNMKPLDYNKEDLTNPHFIALGALLDPETLFELL